MKKNMSKVQDRKGKRSYKKNKLNTLSFFSGAMGLDLGLEKAGFNILLACEIDEASRKTIVTNDDKVGLIGSILDYDVNSILEHANIDSSDKVDVIVGGPPCQAFSTAGKRGGFADTRGNVFLKYIDIIEKIRPKYAVIENVRGLLSTPMMIDIEDEITKTIDFDSKKTQGSSLYYIKKKLQFAGYSVSYNLYNTANFGVPQIRERVVMICTLLEEPVPFLKPTHSNDPLFNLPAWKTFKDAVSDIDAKTGEHINFSEKRLEYIKMLKPGENWRNLPKEIQPIAMGNSYFLGGGKTGFYRRLAWDRPSPTLVTHPAMPATELAHPNENRPLSVEEYKRIQQFPDDWKLQGSTIEKYKQIGNAVPVGLGEAIGRTILNHFRGKKEKQIENFPYSRYKDTASTDWEKAFLLGIKKAKAKKVANKQPEFAF